MEPADNAFVHNSAENMTSAVINETVVLVDRGANFTEDVQSVIVRLINWHQWFVGTNTYVSWIVLHQVH
jgi:hypothetical protein